MEHLEVENTIGGEKKNNKYIVNQNHHLIDGETQFSGCQMIIESSLLWRCLPGWNKLSVLCLHSASASSSKHLPWLSYFHYLWGYTIACLSSLHSKVRKSRNMFLLTLLMSGTVPGIKKALNKYFFE